MYCFLHHVSVRLERERIRSWVNREIQEPAGGKKEKGSLTKSKNISTSGSQLQPPPTKTGNGTKSEASPQKRSPILQRKATKQRKSDTTSVGIVSPTSSERAQLPPPLQPEKLASVGQREMQTSKDSSSSLNGKICYYFKNRNK